MRLLQRLFTDRRAAEAWQAGLVWQRLRYADPAGISRALQLLSRPAAAGRVALVHRPGAGLQRLHLGLPAAQLPLLGRMAGDFAFSARPPAPDFQPPAPVPLAPTASLPWARPFLAHVGAERLFVTLLDEEPAGRRYLPPGKEGLSPAGSLLPDAPGPGLSLTPSWNGPPPPAALRAAGAGAQADPNQVVWPLGRARDGAPLAAAGPINVYGAAAAAAAWLCRQVTRLVDADPAGLLVLDGAGDLVPRLKRQAAVTRRLERDLTYLDLDSPALSAGFNPLAPVAGESEAAILTRWQHWFAGMNVHPQGQALLREARAAGVEDLPGLRKWLRGVERRGQTAAAASLSLALGRLTAGRAVREWLEWPADRFAGLPNGALFLACRVGVDGPGGWIRRQLLRAAFLAAVALPAARLVVHGYPWTPVDEAHLRAQQLVVVSNGPQLPGGAVVLVESGPRAVALLSERFLGDDARLAENLSLLREGEGMIVAGGAVTFSSWDGRQKSGTSAR